MQLLLAFLGRHQMPSLWTVLMPKSNLSKVVRKRHASRITSLQLQLREARLKRWVIQYSWKPGTCTGNPMDWRSWRRIARVPILFRSEEAAQEYLDAVGFKGFENHRKVTASIETRWLKEEAA